MCFISDEVTTEPLYINITSLTYKNQTDDKTEDITTEPMYNKITSLTYKNQTDDKGQAITTEPFYNEDQADQKTNATTVTKAHTFLSIQRTTVPSGIEYETSLETNYEAYVTIIDSSTEEIIRAKRDVLNTQGNGIRLTNVYLNETSVHKYLVEKFGEYLGL